MKNETSGKTLHSPSASFPSQASVRLVRSSTMIIQYNGQKILLDPMFSGKGAFESFAGIEKNPTVNLKVTVGDITEALDFVLVTHTHADHFDKAASDALEKSVILFHQPSDTAYFEKEQFQHAEAIVDSKIFKGIEIIRVNAQHGLPDILKYTGNASGFILRASGQPTIYIVGDSILTDDVRKNILTYTPQYIIVNAGGASLPALNSGPIIMDEEQTLALVKENSYATFIAVHLEALDHCHTTRTSLRKKADEAKIAPDKLIIPKDGETIMLPA